MRRILIYSLATLAACQLSLQVPAGELEEIARAVSAVGHPLSEYKGARFIGGSPGGCMSSTGEKYLDVAVDYSPALSKHTRTMTVRFHVHSTDPCEVTSEVLEDDGPPPVLLDNQIAAPLVGEMICEALSAEE